MSATTEQAVFDLPSQYRLRQYVCRTVAEYPIPNQKLFEAKDTAAAAREILRLVPFETDREFFGVFLLNRKNGVLGLSIVSVGTASSTLVHPREVFRAAIVQGASAIVCFHNHPSGDPSPSAADIQMTRTLREASRIVDIDFLDHVIVGDASGDPTGRGFYSFRDAGVLS